MIYIFLVYRRITDQTVTFDLAMKASAIFLANDPSYLFAC